MENIQATLFDSVTTPETATPAVPETNGISLREIAVLARGGGVTEKKEKQKQKTEVIIEVAEDSAPDLVLRRKTSRSSTLLVLMPTQNLFCVMDEKTKSMTPLDERSLLSFAKDGRISFPEWAGGVIETQKTNREAFVTACNNSDFVELLRWRVVNYATACKCGGGYSAWGYNWRFKDEVREYHNIVKDHRPICEYARVALNPQACLNRFCVSSICEMDSALGLDNCRNVLKGVVDCLRDTGRTGNDGELDQQIVSLTETLSDVFSIRENKGTVRLEGTYRADVVTVKNMSTNVLTGSIVNFDMAAVNRYLFERSEAEGFSDIKEWAKLWRDDLLLQVCVTGKVVEKYPENLLTHHQILSYEASKLVQEHNKEDWKRADKEAEWLDWSDGKYIVTHPHSAADLADEAVQQSNCVRSYESNILDGKLQIAFLRLAADPTKSWVTIEVRERNGVPTVVQCKGRFNSSLNTEQKEALDAWTRNKNVA